MLDRSHEPIKVRWSRHSVSVLGIRILSASSGASGRRWFRYFLPHKRLQLTTISFGTKRSQVQILSPRLFLEISPSAKTSKGFLIAGTRLASSRRQFKKTISRIRRFAA
jgi:hypothetical protein